MAAAAHDAVVSLVGDDAASRIVRGVVPGLGRAVLRMGERSPRALRRPVAPGLGVRVAAVEEEAAGRGEVPRDGAEDRALVFGRQEHLEGVAGEQHQVEVAAEPHVAGVSLQPCHASSAGPLPRDSEHRRGGIDAHYLTRLGERCRQFARAAAEVEHALRLGGQLGAEVEVGAPAVLQIVELYQRGVVIETVAGGRARVHASSSRRGGRCF